MTDFKRGDWVVYDPGYTQDIGRVWEDRGDKVFVCYHFGCTAAASPKYYLSLYDPDKYPDLVPDARIGFHRFDRSCPYYDSSVCFDCDKG